MSFYDIYGFSRRYGRHNSIVRTVGTMPNYNGYYYHYTDSYGANGIMNSGQIEKSCPMAGFPEGVYFVTMAPHIHSKDSILGNNYGSRKTLYSSRADWVVTVPSSALNGYIMETVTLGRRKFYSYPEVVDVTPSQVTQNLRSY